MKKPIVLTIAGSDSGAGAGIQADIKAIHANGCYTTTVITAITSQNTMGVVDIYELPLNVIESQFMAVVEDFDIKAIKIGMLGSRALIELVGELLNRVDAKVVIDPIISSSSKRDFLKCEDLEFFKETLLKRAFLITPNIDEIEILTGMKVSDSVSMREACMRLGGDILLKGAHLDGDLIVDLLYLGGEFFEFSHNRVDSKNTHGTGCTLSSSICCYISRDYGLFDSCKESIDYQIDAINKAYDTGSGSGSLNHFFMLDV